MVAVPAVTPVTIPVPPAVATEEVLLPHAPPGIASLKVVVLPVHMLVVPVIADKGLTVSVFVATQPTPRE